MPINSYEDLSDIQLDVLREIGNIGSGNAATALSNMLGKPTNIKVPKIQILDYNVVTERLGGPEKMIIGMLVNLSDDINGMMLFLLDREFAHITINSLLGQDLGDFAEIDEMGVSMLQEIGNIMAASYVNAISMLTGMTINISTPSLNEDMLGSILSVPAIHFANISDNIIFIDDGFEIEEGRGNNSILLIPDVESLDRLMNALGM